MGGRAVFTLKDVFSVQIRGLDLAELLAKADGHLLVGGSGALRAGLAIEEAAHLAIPILPRMPQRAKILPPSQSTSVRWKKTLVECLQ